MTDQPQRRQHPASAIPTTATYQQSPPCSVSDEASSKAEARIKDQQKLNDSETPSNTDSEVDLFSNLIGDDTKQKPKRDADQILQHDKSTSHQLPNEIVSLIIHQLAEEQETLYECALVTKQFHAIANPFIWQVLIFKDNNCSERFLAYLPDISQQRLATLGQHIRELRLGGLRWTDAQLNCLLPHLPLLEHLTVYSITNITDISFQHLPRHCKHLATLQLDYTRLTQVSFSAIGQHCHQLRDLEWNISKNQEPEWLAMLTLCPLERLRITSTPQAMNEKAMTIIKQFDHLTSLMISQTATARLKSLLLPTTTTGTSSGNPPPLDDHYGISPWPRLTKLVLSPCNAIDDTTWIRFIKSHPYLQRLELTDASHLTDTTLDTMAAWLPELAYVTLSRNAFITPDGVRRLVQQCRHLVCGLFLFCDRLVLHQFPEATSNSAPMMVILDRKSIEKIKLAQRE